MDMPEIKVVLEGLGKGFEAFKSANDARLAEIEKRGAADVVTAEKVERIAKDVADLSVLNVRLSDIEKVTARLDAFRDKVDDNVKVGEAHAKFDNYVRHGDVTALKPFSTKATINTGSGAAGGFLVPAEIERAILGIEREISAVDSLVDVRAQGVGHKKNVNKGGITWGWVGETDARDLTDPSLYAQVTFTSGEIYCAPQVYRFAVEDADSDVVGDLMADIAFAFAKGEGQAVVAGNGSNKPTGFLAGTPVVTSDASRAFGVLQFIKTGAAATLPTTTPVDRLLDLQYSLKSGYRSQGKWVMNKATMAAVMKFKDGQDNYQFLPAVNAGGAPSLMGYPLIELPDMPDIAANAFPIAFGDFKAGYRKSLIKGISIVIDDVTVRGARIYYVHKRTGGNILDSNAIKLLKCVAD
jgi:HK97 family phage major capsid protein